MKKKITREEVLNKCMQMQEAQVENFENRVASMKSDINNQGDSASQTEDRQAGNTELLTIYENELAFSTTDLQYLKSLSPMDAYATVQPGALVITKDILFFIAISTEKFDIDGIEIVGISDRAPIYQVMEGLAKGDSFNFNEAKYKIEDLY